MHAADTSASSAAAGLRHATLAVYAVFFGSGFAFTSWASRIPQVRDGLDLTRRAWDCCCSRSRPARLWRCRWPGSSWRGWAPRARSAIAVLVAAGGLTIVAIGYRAGVAPVVVGLFLLGVGNGTWDVAMNVEGAFVERRLGRSIMPRFHAGFSVGAVSGALLGAGMVALGVSVTAHLLLVAALIACAAPWAVRWFLTGDGPPRRCAAGHPLAAWREPRTLALGFSCSAWPSSRAPGTTGSASPSSTATTRRPRSARSRSGSSSPR